MNTILKILGYVMAGEQAVAQAVPVVAHGVGGTILGIALIAEMDAVALIQALSQKASSTSTNASSTKTA